MASGTGEHAVRKRPTRPPSPPNTASGTGGHAVPARRTRRTGRTGRGYQERPPPPLLPPPTEAPREKPEPPEAADFGEAARMSPPLRPKESREEPRLPGSPVYQWTVGSTPWSAASRANTAAHRSVRPKIMASGR